MLPVSLIYSVILCGIIKKGTGRTRLMYFDMLDLE